MSRQTRTVRPGPRKRTVRTKYGKILAVPDRWVFVEPGDATITRRVKKSGPHWQVRYKKRRKSSKTYSKGIWAPRGRVERIRREVEEMRQSDAYQRRRKKRHQRFVDQFVTALLDVLDFPRCRRKTARRLATAVADHAADPGSGTVVRRHQIPMKVRARLALYAWLRHNTTDYDDMSICRGQRKSVKQRLHRKSERLLDDYRHRPCAIDLEACPLQAALGRPAPGAQSDGSKSGSDNRSDHHSGETRRQPTRRLKGRKRRLFTVE